MIALLVRLNFKTSNKEIANGNCNTGFETQGKNLHRRKKSRHHLCVIGCDARGRWFRVGRAGLSLGGHDR